MRRHFRWSPSKNVRITKNYPIPRFARPRQASWTTGGYKSSWISIKECPNHILSGPAFCPGGTGLPNVPRRHRVTPCHLPNRPPDTLYSFFQRVILISCKHLSSNFNFQGWVAHFLLNEILSLFLDDILTSCIGQHYRKVPGINIDF